MKVNCILGNKKTPSFGLKIVQNQGYADFINRAGGKNWNCSLSDIEDFKYSLENMHFAKEDKNDTSIIFNQAEKRIIGYRTVPSVTYRNTFVNEPCYVTVMPCVLCSTKNPDAKELNFALKLSGSTLDDVLEEIAANYARYSYCKS
ncbi:hypothetical protein IJS77_01300 [bacterium]|nr:hypothetical protein [bacterium]